MITNLLFAFAMTIAPVNAVATAPVETPPPAPTVECTTIEDLYLAVSQNVPDVMIKEISSEPPYFLVFTSESVSTDLKVNFEENGCVTSIEEISKITANQ